MSDNRLFEYAGQWIGKEPGRPSFYRYWNEGRGKICRRSLRTSDLDEAKDSLIEIVKKGAKQNHSTSDQTRLAFLLDQYITEYTPKRRSGSAIDIRIAHIAGFYGGCLVSEITKNKQWEFMRLLRKKHKHSASYIAMIQKALAASLRYAHENERLQSFPFIITNVTEIAEELDIPAPTPRKRVLSMQEMAMMLEWAASDHIFNFILLSINTVARPEAICDLGRTQCNSDFKNIELNPPGRRQTKKYRPVIPMTDFIRESLPLWKNHHDRLLTWRKVIKKGDDPIQVPIKSVKKAVKRLATTLGMDDVSQYTLRHTMATWLRSKAVPKWEVEGIMGHAGDSQTDAYAKYDPNYLSKARVALDDYMIELEKLVKRPLKP